MQQRSSSSDRQYYRPGSSAGSSSSKPQTISELLPPSTHRTTEQQSNHRRRHVEDPNNEQKQKFSYPERRKPRIVTNPVTEPLSPSEQRLKNKHYVFVYGTLRKGFNRSYLLERSTYIGDFRTVNRYPSVVSGKYNNSYLLEVPNTGQRVKGEVYAIDDALLADLDHLERVGLSYTRKVIKVSNIADRSVVLDAYVYFKSNNLGNLVS